MKKCKRILSLLCAIVLVVTLVAPTAMALQGPDVSVPEDYDLIYFVDCGASAFPASIQTLLAEHADTVKNAKTPDQAYNGTWGYTSADATDVYNSGSQDVYESFRCFKETANGQTLQYKFAADAGQYKVYVGLYDPWAEWNKVRQGAVSVNSGAAQTHTYSQGAKLMNFDVTVAGDEGLTVDIAPVGDTVDKDHDVLVSFIMVTKKVEEPQPEQPELPVPGTNYLPFVGDAWVDVTTTCTNDDAAHEITKTSRKNRISAQVLKAADNLQQGEDGTWTCQVTLDAGAMLESVFQVPHTGEDVTATAVYNEARSRWELPAEPLTFTGVCDQNGPEGPNSSNIVSFTVSVYSHEPQLDGEDDYKSVNSSRWDVDDDVTVTFSAPAKNEEGVWTSTATVNAQALLEKVCRDYASENYHWEETEPAVKTVTLTYNSVSGKWSLPNDGVSTSRKGVAFFVEKYYSVTLAPGRDLTQIPAHGEEIVLGAYKTGTPVELPDTTTFTADNGVFAGWRVSIKRTPSSASEVFFFPAGTDMEEMFAHDVTLEAYWMDVVLDVAAQPYDSSLGVDAYTFGKSANFTLEGDTITLLYRAQVQGNSEYPYVLTCDGAEAVYNSELNGAIDEYDASEYVYFTVTYTAAEAAALTEETVTMGNASDSVAVTVEADVNVPEGPRKGNCEDFYVTVYGKEPRTDYMYYSVRSSYRWDTMPSKYQVNITFSEVTQNAEGQWVCTATVDAAAYVEAIAQASASANFFPMDEPTTKTVELTYNESKGKWVAAPDGITYGYPSNPETRNGVAFGLEKRYTVTFVPGIDLKFQAPTGEAPESMVCAPGETVKLPQTTNFVTENGIFAGWTVTIKKYVNDPNPKVYFYPIGTDMTMFSQNVELEAYWMDVELEAATVPYDADLTVKEYTFAPEVSLTPQGDSITVLYRANVLGNSQYPYVLTCDGAEAVYNSELSGAIDYGKTSKYVYFTVTYTAEEFKALTEETVTMGNASGSVPVVHAPDLPVPGETSLKFVDGAWVSVTRTCTNENAVHRPSNSKSGKLMGIPKQYLKAAGNLQQDENGQWTCQVTLDTVAMLSDSNGFNMAHTGEDKVLTAQYNEAKGIWELPAEAVEVTGSCTQNGPEGPSRDNCEDFYITVYGYEPQVDDTVHNSTLRSSRWDLGTGVEVTFTEPQKNDEGVWTCEATIQAEERVAAVYEDFADSHYRRDDTDPTTKTITMTYNQGSGEWVAESDGITYGYPSKPETRNGVAFRLVKQYTVTFVPGRDLDYSIPEGEEVFGGAYDKGAVVELPQTTHFVTENGVFAGWTVTVKEHDYDPNAQYLFYPVGTKTMTMPGKNVEVEAYWMDVKLDVADLPYDENLGVRDYTFGDTANFVIDGDTITVLYRADVRGNSRYPYALTVYGPEATAVYGSELEGTLGVPEASRYVYFTVTYTAEEFEALTQQTVAMGNASDSVNVTVTVEHHAEAVAGVDPTCTEDGSKAYWHCTTCGKYFADESCTQEITQDIDTWKVIPATGHDYGEAKFQWSADGKTCTVTFTCGNDAAHVEKLDANVTSAVKTAPTCTEKGVTAYTATVTFEGETYTDTLELADIPAAGHHYEDGVCTVCGEQDPDYVEPTTEPTKPATDPDGPDQTGETTPVALLMSLLLISAACLGVILAKNRKVRF